MRPFSTTKSKRPSAMHYPATLDDALLQVVALVPAGLSQRRRHSGVLIFTNAEPAGNTSV